jgi:hypothetical protein
MSLIRKHLGSVQFLTISTKLMTDNTKTSSLSDTIAFFLDPESAQKRRHTHERMPPFACLNGSAQEEEQKPHNTHRSEVVRVHEALT